MKLELILSALVGKRVLIVDDNQTNRNILIQQASSLQMSAVGVDSGHEALKLLTTAIMNLISHFGLPDA